MVNRRDVLRGIGVTAAAGLAGCSSDVLNNDSGNDYDFSTEDGPEVAFRDAETGEMLYEPADSIKSVSLGMNDIRSPEAYEKDPEGTYDLSVYIQTDADLISGCTTFDEPPFIKTIEHEGKELDYVVETGRELHHPSEHVHIVSAGNDDTLVGISVNAFREPVYDIYKNVFSILEDGNPDNLDLEKYGVTTLSQSEQETAENGAPLTYRVRLQEKDDSGLFDDTHAGYVEWDIPGYGLGNMFTKSRMRENTDILKHRGDVSCGTDD